MDITLKGVKIDRAMSDETTCFSATVYKDGKKAGTVTNRGCGGSHDYYWTDQDLGKALEDEAAAEVVVLQSWDGSGKIELIYEKLDHFIDLAVGAIEEQRWFKSQCRHKTLFRLKSDGDTPCSWRSVKAVFDKGVKVWLQDRFGDDLGEIANETRV